MKNKFLPFVLLMSAYSAYSQVGVGTLEPNPSSQLEVMATNKGVLIPRIALKSAADVSTIVNGNVNSLLVFNTAKTTDVTPGYYYWYDGKWNKILVSGDVNVSTGAVVFNPVTNEFTYTNAGGVGEKIDLSTIIGANETKTNIVKNTDGTYTYNAEAGGKYTIDVIGDVANNFDTIVNNDNVQKILNSLITNVQGSVSFDATKNEFTYVDASGAKQVINIGDLIKDLVKDSETKTSIDKETDGTYTYNSEDGTYTIDVIGDVTSQFSTIVNNTDVKNILNTIVKNAEGNVTYNVTDTKFTYTDAAGNQQDVAIDSIVKANESKTSIDKETDGTYTYNSEAGTYTIDVIGDVTSQFSTIVNNTDVKNILNTIVKNAEGNVTYNVTDTKFTYTDAAGNQQDVAIGTIVKANESKTSIDKETDGTYTYNSEDGTYTIDVIGDVTSQFSTIVNNTDVKNILNTIVKNAEGNVTYNVTDTKFTYTDAAGNQQDVAIGTIVKANESKTSIDKETDGTYTYNSEDGTYTIDVIGDVTSQFSTIVNNADVKNILNSIVNNVEGNVLYNTATSEFTYKDNTGTEQVIDIATLSKEPWFGVTSKVGAISNTEDIYTKGWVGIGFDAPSGAANEKLRVNGVITTVNNVYADYVFEDYFKGYSDIKTDYKFKGLKEIENFIKTNKHLPGITPIGELTKTKAGYSFNLTELSIQLLEKTEEIYLHIIEQNNTIIAKDKEINELKETSKNMSDRLERLERLMEKMNVSDSKNSLK